MNRLIEKALCLHHWSSHAKNLYPSTAINGNRMEQTVEVLICEKCGKIKQIMY